MSHKVGCRFGWLHNSVLPCGGYFDPVPCISRQGLLHHCYMRMRLFQQKIPQVSSTQNLLVLCSCAGLRSTAFMYLEGEANWILVNISDVYHNIPPEIVLHICIIKQSHGSWYRYYFITCFFNLHCIPFCISKFSSHSVYPVWKCSLYKWLDSNEGPVQTMHLSGYFP